LVPAAGFLWADWGAVSRKTHGGLENPGRHVIADLAGIFLTFPAK